MIQTPHAAVSDEDARQSALILWGRQHDAVRREHAAWELSFSAQAALIYSLQGGTRASGHGRLELDADMIEETERLASSLAELGRRMRIYEQLSAEIER